MKSSRLPIGTSDPISYICTCAASSDPNSGLILLFYRYVSSPPTLHPSPSQTPQDLASFHTSLTSRLQIGGKIRVSKEGFNITVGGTREAIHQYINECVSHWSLAGLDLDTEVKRDAYFKPGKGCACAFEGACSVRVTSEITPMGVTNYTPKDWSQVISLKPEDFHSMCLDKKAGDMIVDVRNHYESRIGYFVDGEGEKALRPQVRRFSQWPLFVKRKIAGEVQGGGEGRSILTYCTGGIRCEKGARFLQESLADTSSKDKVFTLKGGIAAYQTWISSEIAAGRMSPSSSLFKGRNYVFDARGSTGLSLPSVSDTEEAVAECHVCGTQEERLSKCRSKGCHLILVICEKCETGDVRCCENCLELDRSGVEKRPICECEKKREACLWGSSAGTKIKSPKQKRRVKNVKSPFGGMDIVDIRIKTLE